jgi:hypothetical protein
MENDGPVVGPDAPTAKSKMVNWKSEPGLESATLRFARDPGADPLALHDTVGVSAPASSQKSEDAKRT